MKSVWVVPVLGLVVICGLFLFGSQNSQTITPQPDDETSSVCETETCRNRFTALGQQLREQRLKIDQLNQQLLRLEKEKEKEGRKREEPKKSLYKEEQIESLEEDPNNVPQLVRAWRHAKLDYHDIALMPRYLKPNGALREHNFAPLLSLLNTHNGVKRYGSLYNYEFCKVVQDKCILYDYSECSARLECGWCSSLTLCMRLNATTALGEPWCPVPVIPGRVTLRSSLPKKDVPSAHHSDPHTAVVTHILKDGGLTRLATRNSKAEPAAADDVCKGYMRGRPVIASFGDNAAAMYYHWYRDFMQNWWDSLGPSKSDDERLVIVPRDINSRIDHVSNLGLVSKECFRFLNEIPDGTCFYSSGVPAKPQPWDNDMVRWVYNRVGLGDPPKPTAPHIGILSRKYKRFLLNEQELLHEALKMGISAELLPLDEWPLYMQLKAIGRTTILIGIHGSGFVNNLFLPKGAVSIQVMPYKTHGGAAFFAGFAATSGVIYNEYTIGDANDTILHWDTLKPADRARKDSILAAGGAGGIPFFFTLWINQDTYLPPSSFREWIQKALAQQQHHQKEE